MNMNAIVLAAGRGSRMGEMTANRPKCLVEVNDKTLLSYQLEALHQGGCDLVGFVSGYRREQLADYFHIEFHNSMWSSTNMVASLFCAEAWLNASTCIVSYSDLFYFSDAVEVLAQAEEDICVLYDQNWYELWAARFENPLDDAETFMINEHGFLTEIGQKASDLSKIQGQYMGLFKLSPSGWNIFSNHARTLFEQKGQNIYITDVLHLIAKQNSSSIKAMPFSGNWGEVDSESDLLFYNDRERNKPGGKKELVC